MLLREEALACSRGEVGVDGDDTTTVSLWLQGRENSLQTEWDGERNLWAYVTGRICRG